MKKLLLLWCCVAPGLALATPPQGVELKIRRGFFTETNIGGFFTLGGLDGYSNAESYLQLGVGYDVLEHLEVGLSFGLGTSAADCFSQRNGPLCAQAENFTMMFLDGSAAYKLPLSRRFFLSPKIFAGWTLLDPAPVKENGREVRSAPNVGAGVGVEYFTAMDHFSVGADVQVRYVLAANIPGIAIFPRVKYTF